MNSPRPHRRLRRASGSAAVLAAALAVLFSSGCATKTISCERFANHISAPGWLQHEVAHEAMDNPHCTVTVNK